LGEPLAWCSECCGLSRGSPHLHCILGQRSLPPTASIPAKAGTYCSVSATRTVRAGPAVGGSPGSAPAVGIEQWVLAFARMTPVRGEATLEAEGLVSGTSSPHFTKVIPIPSTRIKLPPSPHRSEIMTSGWCGETGWSGSRSGPGQSSVRRDQRSWIGRPDRRRVSVDPPEPGVVRAVSRHIPETRPGAAGQVEPARMAG
jgi:hypothetical protein